MSPGWRLIFLICLYIAFKQARAKYALGYGNLLGS